MLRNFDMKRIILGAVFIAILSPSLEGQVTAEEEIRAVIDQLFDGMRAGDSTLVKPLFVRGSVLSSIGVNRDNEVRKQSSNASNFITAIGQPKDKVWDELIWSYDIKIDHPMAMAWTEYSFYLGDDLSHCGVNVFELIRLVEGWKISAITDTRRTRDCKTREDSDINTLLDDWHMAAATADEELFFGSMTPDAIYIGTDKSERWKRDDMRVWSKEIFERESAWSFTKVERHINLSESKDLAWFDETLDTWMGPCRGSGIVVQTEEGWKIKHYHLAIAVPNDAVDGYLELIGQPGRK